MGICCSLCCMICLKYTNYSIVLAEKILNNITTKLRNIILSTNHMFSGLDKWHVSLKYNEVLKNALKLKIFNALKKLKFPVLDVDYKLTQHLNENISFIIVKLIFDEAYYNKLNGNEYDCLDISYDIPFYTEINIFNFSKIEISDEAVNTIKNLIRTIKNENDNIEILSLEETTNDIHKQIFDNNLEKIILQSINKISNEKMEEIITNVDKRIMYYNNKNIDLLNKNK